ncbi:MAG: LptA/OstA family protein [Rickettsiales bacterium]
MNLKAIIFFIQIFIASSCWATNIVIDSLKMNVNFDTQIATYTEQVVVNSGKHRLECDKMEVFYGGEKKDFDGQNLSINKIRFYDKIIMNDEVRVINADSGEYIAKDRVVYFWDNVKIKENGSYLEADKIKYDMKKELVTILNMPNNNGETAKDERVRIIIEDK